MRPAHDTEFSSRIRETLEDARRSMRKQLLTGVPGTEVCLGLSDVHDAIVRELWRRAVEGLSAREQDALALVATGGWGRRELCPYSDIDFLLVAPRKLEAVARAVMERILYPLWDAKVRVGSAVRDAHATADLVRSDLATATSLLDARHIAGNEEVTVDLMVRSHSAMAPGGNPNDFVTMLSEEKDRRHQRFGDSIYLLEPNLKQGIGALRDLATAIWAARARWGGDLSDLVSRGELSERQLEVLTSGRDFLLELRCLVQLSAGRPTDQLTFEVQESIAPALFPDDGPSGDSVPAVAPAVESLMRRYYLHARGIVRVGDRLLESARVPARRKPRIVRVDGSFLLFNGKVAVRDPALFRDDPAEMLRLFRVAATHDRPVYGHTKELVEENVAHVGGLLTGDRRAAGYFLEALTDLHDGAQPSLLSQMHQVGLLSAMIPEFGPCTCRVQHDLYHVYTVDQHQLYAVAMLKQTMRGELVDSAPVATEVAREVGASPPLFIATLLHDVGKPLGKGHAEKGAIIAARACRRLGLSEADAKRAEFLVRQHLTMSHLSQRRDLSDPDVIDRFADRVGSEDALAELFLLTRCDTAMTAPGNLTAWKDQLLNELYVRTRDRFRGRGTEIAKELERTRRRATELIAEDVHSAESADLIARLDERFVGALSSRQLARHAQLGARFMDAPERALLEVTPFPGKGHTEVAVVAKDVPGLLADIAGVFAAHRVDVGHALVTSVDFPKHGEIALDLFYVTDSGGRFIPTEDPRWERIGGDLHDVLGRANRGEAVERLIESRRSGSGLPERVTPAVDRVVRVFNEESAAFTVVEVFTRNRVGVLHAITRALADAGLDIQLSKISTAGEVAEDVFYVEDRGTGAKLEDEDRIADLKREIAAALELEEER